MAGPTDIRITPITPGVRENTSLLNWLPTALVTVVDRDGGRNVVGLEGRDAALFNLERVFGSYYTLQLKPGVRLDFETTASLELRVVARDVTAASGISAEHVVRVIDVNEAPVITSFDGAARAQIEVPVGTLQVADLDAEDVDAGARLSYSLSGPDRRHFTIDAQTGELQFRAAPTEAARSYEITVTVRDQQGLRDTQHLTITTTDPVEEPPEPTALFTPPAGTTSGSSDASTALALDGGLMLVGDDEANVLRVYDRDGGPALAELSFDAYLGLDGEELDVEGSTRVGDTIVVIGSHGNSSSGRDQDHREWLFAAELQGEGADTRLNFSGRFNGLEAALVAWDGADAHGRGAGHYGLAAAAASGSPERDNGLGIEGLTTSPDGQSLWLAFRAPVTEGGAARTALIVPLDNITDVLGGTGVAPAFGAPIELDLGGRGIRSIERNADGDYLVLAGPSGPASADVADDFRLYRWDGRVDAQGQAIGLVQQAVALDALLENGASFESIVEVPAALGDGSWVQLLQDNGDTLWSGQTQVSKDLPPDEQQFRGNWVQLGGAAPADVSAPTLLRSDPADDAQEVSLAARPTLVFDEPVRAGQGSFVLMAGSTPVLSLAADAPEVSHAYNRVQLDLGQLQPGTRYTLTWQAGTVVDAAGNPHAGAQGAEAIDFTTPQALPEGTTLQAGDLLFLAVNGDAPDAMAFTLLKPVEAGTRIVFTDRDFSGGAFPASGESAFVWTATEAVPAGTVVTVQVDTADALGNPTVSHGVAQGRTGGISTSAETVHAFQGEVTGLADGAAGALSVERMLAAINTGGGSAGEVPADVPTWTFTTDNAIYAGAFPADLQALAAAVRDPAQWATSDATPAALVDGQIVFPQPTPISAIQGVGEVSPLAGQNVTVEARVTAWLPELRLFFVQEESADQDGDARSSEGLAVYYGNAPAPVDAQSIGDLVRLSGTVTEFNGLTELTTVGALTVVEDGTPASLDAAVPVTLPLATAEALEAFEGMFIEVTAASGGALYASDTYTFGRYGEIVFHADAVPQQYTQQNLPDVAGHAQYLDFLARNSLQLDDRSGVQNPTLATLQSGDHPLTRGGELLSPDNFVRVGDTVNSLSGVLSYGFGAYELQPVGTVDLTPAPRPAAPTDADLGQPDIRVASFNVLNYFTTLSGNFTNPYGTSHAQRGANDPEEFARQQTKIVEAMLGTGADVFGLMEMQNNGFADEASAIDDLVDALNAAAGAGRYDFIRAPYQDGNGSPEPTAGDDAIMVAIVYDTTRVQALGQAAVPDVATYTAFAGDNRVPVAQTFAHVDDASRQFTMVVNHFKSKGSLSSNFAGDADAGDGQGNNNPTRLEAAVDLARWLATDPTGATDGDYLLVGDFNSYAMEDPIRFLSDAAFDASAVYGGYDIPADAEALRGSYDYLGSADDHGYVFDGLRGSLDHALASTALASEVTGIVHWHINADEQLALDYDTRFDDPALYAPDAFRSSDHDPIVIGLRLNSEAGSPDGPPPPPPAPQPPPTPAPTPAVFINELHYDNAGSDTGEAIGVAGPAGTDLSGWQIVLYNGNGGAVYNTRVLSGLIDDEGLGFGELAFSYPTDGLQNGAPDGVALVDAQGQVLQFLSYEGSFVAVGGLADGMRSVDIGVAETSSTPAGHSLQLIGQGLLAGDFDWAAPAGSSFGSLNDGQVFG